MEPTLLTLGVLFDWDGVIIDSSRHHETSWEWLAEEEGKPLPEGHFKRGFGQKNEVIIPTILGWTHDGAEIQRLSMRKEELYRRAVTEHGVEALPGVRSLLVALQAAGVPTCVGSSTHRANIELSLSQIGLAGLFADLVTAEDVTAGKPDPEVFLRAASRIQRAPENCVVFEDAFAGLQAAAAGGMKRIAVATTHPAEALRDHADRVVTRLDEVDVPSLLALWTG